MTSSILPNSQDFDNRIVQDALEALRKGREVHDREVGLILADVARLQAECEKSLRKIRVAK